MKVYTRTGDDGTTGLFYGGRVRKDAPAPAAYGDVDEAQAHIGLARALAVDAPSVPGGHGVFDEILVSLARDLWVLMAELATDPANHAKLNDGTTKVTGDMVVRLEHLIDSTSELFDPPTEFVVPGESVVAAQLDVARTVARRAERSALGVEGVSAQVLAYLNRLSDLLWTLARWAEGQSLTARSAAAGDHASGDSEEPSDG
ncbi:MAG: cob(I)yrinic acid a,c-diamide adenosyltransferase [Microthrixaceae bacterium]